MSAFGKSRSRGSPRASRESAPLLVVISTVGHDHHASLVNISSDGACLAAPVLPAEGEQVIFRAEYVQEFGRVVWSAADLCVIKFETPISADNVEYLRRKANIPSLTGLAPEDLPAIRDWPGVSQ